MRRFVRGAKRDCLRNAATSSAGGPKKNRPANTRYRRLAGCISSTSDAPLRLVITDFVACRSPAMGGAVATTVNYYSTTDPTAVRQAFGATALFVGGLGAGGYAIRRDLSFLYRTAFWLLVGLIVAGVVLIFVRIPGAYTIYALFGLAIFRLYTVI